MRISAQVWNTAFNKFSFYVFLCPLYSSIECGGFRIEKLFVECSGSAGELAAGNTLFLAVQPKFMNVDIRITIDVTQGALVPLERIEK